MFTKPNISVILTTYNSGSRLQQTLDSIRGQNGTGEEFNVELIVIDDCSTDNTQEILWQNHVDFLSTKKNSGGPNKGRNMGLDRATGNFICLIDHDDIWHPDKTRLQLQVAKNVPIVSTAYMLADSVTNKSATYGVHKDAVAYYPKHQAFLYRLSKDKQGPKSYLSTLMINSALRHIRFEEHFGMVDYDWFLRLFENQATAEISAPLMIRRVNKHNLSINNNYRKNDYYYSLLCLESYEEQYPRHVRLGRKRLHGSRARYHYMTGQMRSARTYFKKSSFRNIKTLLYYCTSFYGSHFVTRHFRVFG